MASSTATSSRRKRDQGYAEPPVISGRVPPHNLDAEAAVLSACLLDKEALDRVLGTLQPDHFYSDANRLIYEACQKLVVSGTPVDVVTVADWLRKSEAIQRAGGTAYLGQITDATPAPGNVMAHANIVREKWRLRRAIAVCHKYAADGYGDVVDAEEFLDGLEQDVHDVNHQERPNEVEHVKDVLRSAFKKISAAAESGGTITGVPTRYVDLDKKIAGLHRGDLMIVAGRPGMGKAQPLDARVLTPSGWRLMGSIEVGDEVIAHDGTPARVLGVYDQGERDVYRVTTVDGASTECSDEHLWFTSTRKDRVKGRPGQIRPLSEIRATMKRGDGARNHAIPYMAPAQFKPLGDLPLDPYVLGVWLGDGCAAKVSVTICNPELDIEERMRPLLPEGDRFSRGPDGLTLRIIRPGRGPSVTRQLLEAFGLGSCRSWQKWIPEAYLRASVEDRVRLLQGLCDTDGYVAQPKLIEYTTTSPGLMAGIQDLVQGLGGVVTVTHTVGKYRKGGEVVECRAAFRMRLRFPHGDVCPVSSHKHLSRWTHGPGRLQHRFLDKVEPAGRKPVRCIAIDHPSHLYVTDGCMVTHNTSLVLNMAVNIASPEAVTVYGDEPHSRPEEVTIPGLGVAVFSLEMPKEQVAFRLTCLESRVDLGKLRQGFLTEEDWHAITQSAAFLSGLPIHIDDTPAIGILELRAKIRRLQVEHQRAHGLKDAEGGGIGLVVIDYLQLMSGSKNAQSREQEISGISRGLKTLAKELNVPVVALSQLNRGVETRGGKDKRPMISDLRESGAIEQDADCIIFVYRDEYYNRETTQDRGIAELIIAKQRNGPTGTVRTRFISHCTKFENLAPGEYEDFEEL